MSTVLQINSCANWGSTGRIAEQINLCAAKEGWNTYFAYGDISLPSESQLIRIGNFFSRGEALLESRLFDNDGLSSRLTTKCLIKHIKSIKPDLIHIHNLHGYYINYRILINYIVQNDIPVVWTMHDCWGITGHCAHFALHNCEKWKTQCGHCPAKNRYPKSVFLDSSSKNFIEKKRLFNSIERLVIVPVSEWLGNLVKQSIYSDKSIQVVSNGVDTGVFSPRQDNATTRAKYGLSNEFVILGVGTTWLPYKGLNDFYSLRQLLSDDYVIILVGLSDSDIRNLPKGIIGLPKTSSQKELADLYSMADCVMSLSRLESFGLTPVEGFACGTPAIVYDNVALSELITDKTGYKVVVGDIGSLKQCVEEIRKKGKTEYSSSCRKRAVEYYNSNKCYKEYIRIYNSLLGK